MNKITLFKSLFVALVLSVFSSSLLAQSLEPATGVTATWSIEEGDTLESFSAVTVTFAGVDSIGRKLDGTEVTKAYMMISTTATFFSVDADGKATPVVADLAEDYDGVLSGTNAGLSTTMKVRDDRFTLVDGAYNKKGNYRIVIPAGTVLMQPNRADAEKVYNDTEFVLNFVIDNDYEETTTPVETEAFYTTNPVEGSKVAEIREVVITFEDVTALTLADLGETLNPSVWPFCNKVVEDEDFGTQTSPIAPMACAVEGNALTLSVVANEYTDSLDYITAFGDYTITIPAGVVFFSEAEINEAITLTYKIGEILPDTVRFANIAAIYKKGIWEKERYADYSWYETIAILESQPTVVDVVTTSGMMGGNINNYYLNDGTGVVVLQAEGDMINPIMDEETWETIGWDTIPGLSIEIGKKLPAEFFATIDFKAVMDDETFLPTGEVYGAPVLTFMPKVLGVEVDEFGWEDQITESYADFAARCEASDFIEAIVFANIDDVLANRIKYAGLLLKVDTAANYYAETMMDHMTGGEKTTAYFYWDAETAFDVESYEEEGTTYVFVSPKYTEDYYNYAGQVFNVLGENLPAAAFDAEATMSISKVRFDWNSVAMGQSFILKEGWKVADPTVDVDNNFALVNVYSNNGAVYVEAEAGAMIEVYTVNGIRVFAGVSNTNTTVINGLNNIAIIRVNGVVYKTIVK